MNWEKQGFIFKPNGTYSWMNEYAAQVCPVEFPNFIRVYFTTRSKLNSEGNYEANITFVDCNKENPKDILYIHNKPLLSLGQAGTFDEHGIMMSDIVFHDNKYYLYYLGWQRSTTVPYITTLGLAISEDGIIFKKVSQGPIIGLSKHSPFGIAKTSVMVEDGIFYMWYTHYNSWFKTTAGYRPTYDIRLTTSANGVDWELDSHVCIAPMHNLEALGAPCVRKVEDTYHMWFGYRDTFEKGEHYKLGYATSKDKTTWQRQPVIISSSKSEEDWDSQMICYPYVYKNLLFYSGNNYGQKGFGYAKLSSYI